MIGNLVFGDLRSNMNTLKQVFSAVAVTMVIFFPLSGTMDEIKDRLYKSIEKPMIYNAGVYTIDKAAKFVSKSIVLLTHITHKKEVVLQKIDHRLTQIEDNIRKDQLNAIDGMYQEFNVPREDQQTINSILRQYKELQKQNLLSSIQNECETLESVFPEVLSFCKQVNINPSAVKLKISDLEISDPSSIPVAEARGLQANYQFENDTLIVNDKDIINYPSVTLYPSFFELSYEKKIACFAHELTHLALQHYATMNILGMEIRYFTGAKKEEIIKSKNWKKK